VSVISLLGCCLICLLLACLTCRGAFFASASPLITRAPHPHPLITLCSYSASLEDVLDAFNWVIANRQAYSICSINLSFGGYTPYKGQCPSSPWSVAIAEARAMDLLTAISSGNEGWTDSMGAPACAPAAVSVAAVYDTDLGAVNWDDDATDSTPGLCIDSTTRAKKVACSTNSSPYLTMLAPGALITAGGDTWGGSSQAAPHVAAAIAVLKSAVPRATPNEIVAALVSGGESVTDTRTGAGSRVKPFLQLLPAINALNATVAARLSDDLPPSVTISINDGSEFVGVQTVSVRVVAADSAGITGLCLGSTEADCTAPGAYEAVAGNLTTLSVTRQWLLSAGDGLKVVWAFVRDQAGNTGRASATISIDTSPPRILQYTINNGAKCTNNYTVQVALSATHTFLTEFQRCWGPRPLSGSCLLPDPVQPYETVVLSLYDQQNKPYDLQHGLNATLYVVVFGASGKKTFAMTSIRVDQEPPAISSFVINGGMAVTASEDVMLQVTGSDPITGIAGMCVSTSSALPAGGCGPGVPGSGYLPYAASQPWTLSAGPDGERKLYVWLRDGCGNTSPSPLSTSIVLARATINGGAAVTAARLLNVDMPLADVGNGAAALTSMCISETSTCKKWQPLQMPTTFKLSRARGPKTVRIKLRDASARESPPLVAEIIYDASAPAMKPASVALAGAAVNTSTIRLTWNPSGASDGPSGSGVVGHRVAVGASKVASKCKAGDQVVGTGPGVGTVDVGGLRAGTKYYVRLCAVDAAGNRANGLRLTVTTSTW